jgi:hypothetical protein
MGGRSTGQNSSKQMMQQNGITADAAAATLDRSDSSTIVPRISFLFFLSVQQITLQASKRESRAALYTNEYFFETPDDQRENEVFQSHDRGFAILYIFSISVLCVDLSARLFFYFPQRSASVVSETTAPLFRLLLSQNLVGWSGGRLHVDSLILRTEGSNADRFTSVSKID